jgi:hypothetical protein
MANILLSPEYVKATGSVAIEAPRELAPWAGFDVSVPAAGYIADTQPVEEPGNAKAGSIQPMFGFADWYDRIHVTPAKLEMGYVVAAQTQDLTVWNAYMTPKTLSSITSENVEGIGLTQPAPTPLTYQALRERTYTITVTDRGPNIIDAAYQFNFVGANSPLVEITGIRITAWTWAPNWGEPMIERLEWLTDTLVAFDGTEQRIQLREYPRRALEFSFGAQGKQRRRLDIALYGWGARGWALPFWPDGQRLEASLLIGDLVVPVSTTNRDFTAGGLVMLLADDGTSEVIEIESVAADSLTLARGVLRDWPATSAVIYPVHLARLPASHGFQRFTHDYVDGRVRFDFQDASAWPAAVETNYRGLPVLTEKPNWVQDIDQTMIRKLSQLDYGTGQRAFDDESNLPEILQSYRWFLDTRTKIAAFRSWLYSRAGKAKAVWVPTWADDLQLAADAGAAATTIDVENVDYTKQIWPTPRLHRRDIRIELTSGAVYYRRITGAAEINTTIERLGIDSAVGVILTPATVRSISFLALARLDADGVEINWFTGDSAEAAHNLRATGNVV